MPDQKTTKKQQKMLRCVVGDSVNRVVSNANELQVTNKEFLTIKQFTNGFVLVYYR